MPQEIQKVHLEKHIGPGVLRHRIILTYESEAQSVTSDAIVKKILNTVPVP